MSKTIVDMPKVAQMLDAGWIVSIKKTELRSYGVAAFHPNGTVRDRVRKLLIKRCLKPDFAIKNMPVEEAVDLFHYDDEERLITDDFTPEQALTRMAYKVFGEILT